MKNSENVEENKVNLSNLGKNLNGNLMAKYSCISNNESKIISPTKMNLMFDHENLCFQNQRADRDHMNVNNLGMMQSASFKKETDILCRIKNMLDITPSKTNFLQSDLIDFVTFHKQQIFNFIENNSKQNFRYVSSFNEILNVSWPNSLCLNYFGIHYNLSKTSEEIELLNLSIIERFITSETSSSFKLSPCKIKKKKYLYNSFSWKSFKSFS